MWQHAMVRGGCGGRSDRGFERRPKEWQSRRWRSPLPPGGFGWRSAAAGLSASTSATGRRVAVVTPASGSEGSRCTHCTYGQSFLFASRRASHCPPGRATLPLVNPELSRRYGGACAAGPPPLVAPPAFRRPDMSVPESRWGWVYPRKAFLVGWFRIVELGGQSLWNIPCSEGFR